MTQSSIIQHIVLEYLPTPRSRKWRRAYCMHLAGRDNMEKDAKETARIEGWHAWRIEVETLATH